MHNIQQWIDNLESGRAFCSRELLMLGSRSAIDKSLSRLAKTGRLQRVARGIYAIPKEELSQNSTEQIQSAINAISRCYNLPIQVNTTAALSNLGLCNDKSLVEIPPKTTDSTLCAMEFCWSAGERKFTIQGQQIKIRKVSPRKVALCNRKAGLAITSIWGIGKNKMTTTIMERIINNLPKKEIDDLYKHASALPSWATNYMQKLSNTQESKGAESDNESKGTHLPQTSKNKAKPTADHDQLERAWTPSTVEGRWCGFGPYYAMFPVQFARRVIADYCPNGGTVIDPFCGRGTVPFVAMVTGRRSIGSDINPVAWLYAKVKTDPYPKPEDIISRANEIQAMVGKEDCVSENEFQELAWSPKVLGFLNTARKQLDWRNSPLDRSLMGTLLIHLHAKLGDGVSNQLRQSKAMAPDYSVKWWRDKGMLPPDVNVVELVQKKLAWRYKNGILKPKSPSRKPDIFLGDCREVMKQTPSKYKADLIFTSPPYYGITNYRYDNWIRLWLLNEGPALPEADSWARHGHQAEYKKLLDETFIACSHLAKRNATVYVRTDARKFTLETTITSLKETWPNKDIYFAFDGFKKATQTALFGDKEKKPGEIDLLALPKNKSPVQQHMTLLTDDHPVIST